MRKVKRKKGKMVMKIDLEKVYDQGIKNFSRSTTRYGFQTLRVELIMHCVSLAELTLLWNGDKLSSSNKAEG